MPRVAYNRTTNEKIEAEVVSHGHKLISIFPKKRLNGKTAMHVKLKCGCCNKEFITSIHQIKNNCKFCAFEPRKLEIISYSLDKCEKLGHRFIELTLDKKIKFKCGVCGEENIASPYSLRKRCWKCRNEYSRHSLEYYKKLFDDMGHSFSKVELDGRNTVGIGVCGKCGSDIRTKGKKGISKDGCSKCLMSKNQSFLVDLLRKEFPKFNIEPNNQDLLKKAYNLRSYLEIDIVVKKDNKVVLCIEWNGIYWHSNPYVEKKDRLKKRLIENLNLKFLQIVDPGNFSEEFVISVFKEKIKPLLEI